MRNIIIEKRYEGWGKGKIHTFGIPFFVFVFWGGEGGRGMKDVVTNVDTCSNPLTESKHQ